MDHLIGRIRRNLVGLLGFIQRDLRQSGFRPVAFELRIDDRPDAEPGRPPHRPRQLADGAGHISIVGNAWTVSMRMPLENKTGQDLSTWSWTTRPAARSVCFRRRSTTVWIARRCCYIIPLYAGTQRADGLPRCYGGGVEYLLADPAPER